MRTDSTCVRNEEAARQGWRMGDGGWGMGDGGGGQRGSESTSAALLPGNYLVVLVTTCRL